MQNAYHSKQSSSREGWLEGNDGRALSLLPPHKTTVVKGHQSWLLTIQLPTNPGKTSSKLFLLVLNTATNSALGLPSGGVCVGRVVLFVANLPQK